MDNWRRQTAAKGSSASQIPVSVSNSPQLCLSLAAAEAYLCSFDAYGGSGPAPYDASHFSGYKII